MTSFIPSFRLNLNRPIRPGLVALGRFDGAHPSLAFATSPDTILIHSPHDPIGAAASTSFPSQLRTLALNRTITALTAGSLSSTLSVSPCDQLLVGGDTSILCYDVESNKDLFFHDLKDGVHALTVGRLSSSSISPSLCFVGGNSAVTGLDMMGIESYWTAMSDSVGALSARQPAKDSYELLVGTNDSSIRILSATSTLSEIHEAAPIKHLSPIQHSLFAFSLSNGSVGVYNNSSRLWMAKSKHSTSALAAFDLDGDGLNELISGWSHGRLEARQPETGELVYKDKFAGGVASVLVGDLRGEGKQEIIACSVGGEVRGYAPLDASRMVEAVAVTEGAGTKAVGGGAAVAASGVAALKVGLADDEMLDGKRKELYDKKNDLLDELRMYENAIKNSKNAKSTSSASSSSAAAAAAAATAVSSPSSTQLTLSLRPNKSTQSQLLSVQTNNDCVIKMLIVFADGMFGSCESKCLIPAKEKLSGSLSMTLRSDKNVSADVRIKVVVGHRGSPNDHLFDFVHSLPRFSNFLYCKTRDMNPMQPPKGSVTFQTTERVNRLVLWLNSAFYLDTNPSMSVPGSQSTSPLTLSVTSDSLLVSFLHLLSLSPLIIKMTPDHGGTVIIKTDSLELAGDLIQDFASYCKLDEVESICDFPTEAARLEELMQSVAGHNDARMRMGGDMAEKTQQIKMAVVRAEDARLIGEPERTRKGYQQVWDGNREMIADYVKREGNQAELFRNLKEVNQMIQKAARCRVGEAKNRVIAACRAAIKTTNTKALLKIIKVGKERD